MNLVRKHIVQVVIGSFIAVALFWLGGNWVDGLQNSAAHTLSVWASIILFFWFYFSGITRFLYLLVGAKRSTKKHPSTLNHQQAEELGKLWVVFLATSIISWVLLRLFFDHQNDFTSSAELAAALLIFVLLSYINGRRKIMGHKKEELFQ